MLSGLVHFLCLDVETNVVVRFGKILSLYGLRQVEPKVVQELSLLSDRIVMCYERRKVQPQGRSIVKHCPNPYSHNVMSDATCWITTPV